MIPVNPLDQYYDEITILGQPALYTNLRIERTMLPQGLFCYDIRHGDSGTPCEIKEHVLVNHLGTVIVSSPILLDKSPFGDYKAINEDALNFAAGDINSISGFIRKYPPSHPDHRYPLREATSDFCKDGDWERELKR